MGGGVITTHQLRPYRLATRRYTGSWRRSCKESRRSTSGIRASPLNLHFCRVRSSPVVKTSSLRGSNSRLMTLPPALDISPLERHSVPKADLKGFAGQLPGCLQPGDPELCE